jgi:hypothetical protein
LQEFQERLSLMPERNIGCCEVGSLADVEDGEQGVVSLPIVSRDESRKASKALVPLLPPFVPSR